VRQKSFSTLINLLSVSVFARSFGSKFVNEKYSREMFYGAFLSFAFHARPILASSTISYSFGCKDSTVKDFGGPCSSIKTAGSHTVTFAS